MKIFLSLLFVLGSLSLAQASDRVLPYKVNGDNFTYDPAPYTIDYIQFIQSKYDNGDACLRYLLNSPVHLLRKEQRENIKALSVFGTLHRVPPLNCGAVYDGCLAANFPQVTKMTVSYEDSSVPDTTVDCPK